MKIDFIDLAAQQKRIKVDLDARIQKVLSHGQYILGPEVADLESELARYVGIQHAITVSSGTDALLIALMALGIGQGDEVITTPFTFMATGEMIALLGATPVFVDIDPKTYNLSPTLTEKAITSRTRAIVPVSLYGQCADFDAFNDIGHRHRIPVIEDAAQSFGATYKGKRSCGLSLLSCTSFFPSKPLGGYGDGGACFTNDDSLARAIREILNHGQEKRYYHTRIGLNGRFDTLQAAVLLAKMPILEDEIKRREEIGGRYSMLIQEQIGEAVVTPHIESWNTSPYAQYTIQVDQREHVQTELMKNGIPTAVHYPMPLNVQPAFKGMNLPQSPMPETETAAKRVLSLPMHPYLTETMQLHVVKTLKTILGKSLS